MIQIFPKLPNVLHSLKSPDVDEGSGVTEFQVDICITNPALSARSS